MFVIGKSIASVDKGKLMLPQAYHLNSKRILGKWKNKKTLYLSDSYNSLNYVVGNRTAIFELGVDTVHKISLPMEYENSEVEIIGCVSTIELNFNI